MAIDTHGVKVEDRPFDQVRQEAIDQLIMNYSHGVISAEAFERRLDVASDATSFQELIDVVSDLSLKKLSASCHQISIVVSGWCPLKYGLSMYWVR